MVGSNFSTSTDLANCYSKSLHVLCALGTETCSNLNLSSIQHSRILLYQFIEEMHDVFSTNILWQQLTSERKKQWQKEVFPLTILSEWSCLNCRAVKEDEASEYRIQIWEVSFSYGKIWSCLAWRIDQKIAWKVQRCLIQCTKSLPVQLKNGIIFSSSFLFLGLALQDIFLRS